MTRYERFDGGGTTLALALEAECAPRLIHFGSALPPGADLVAIDDALAPPRRGGTPDIAPRPTIFPVSGFGWMGLPALSGAGVDGDQALAWTSSEAKRSGESLEVDLEDPRHGLRGGVRWRFDAEHGVLAAGASLRNEGEKPFAVESLASISLPLPAWASEILCFSGEWARELQPHRFPAPPGLWSSVNRTGRTDFGGSTFVVLEPGANEFRGRVLAFHLAWSGSHVLAVETQPDGSRQAHMAALIEPGEVILERGAEHAAPSAYACFSERGLTGVRQRFHGFVRQSILPDRARAPRRVHFNSWEGVYFDFDSEKLMGLADAAADLGAERFVLDDGWFIGRRHDRAGLGDWRVDAAVLPGGLDPVIDHVERLGMDFGLWVEPEMVNPDSDLYRTHPDWCVHAPGAPRPTMRNQLWLDLSRPEVLAHIVERLDALLAAHRIAYLKWDCNRMIFPAVSGGRPAGQAITRGVYAALDALRDRHPLVEIESCASGGGRIDLEILRRCSRVWASDTTDAIERLRIQRWLSLLLPLEAIGAHVGPSPNPITGRRLPMSFRAKVVMFGHMGVELDPTRLDARETESLKAHIAIFKRHRALLRGGRLMCWTGEDGVDGRIVVAEDGAEAIALAVRADVAPASAAAPLRLPGLDPDALYDVSLLEPWPSRAARRLAEPEAWRTPRRMAGRALAEIGLRLPLAEPETAWLIFLRREG